MNKILKLRTLNTITYTAHSYMYKQVTNYMLKRVEGTKKTELGITFSSVSHLLVYGLFL